VADEAGRHHIEEDPMNAIDAQTDTYVGPAFLGPLV
jgi:hypothetical protein